MKLKLPIFCLLLAAMGPAREAPPPPEAPKPRVEAPQPPADAASPPAALTLREASATETAPEDFLWTARPVVVFADTPDDPAFREQLAALRARPQMLAERDVVLIADADPAAGSAWRRQLHPRGFSLVIIDKDGQVKLRKPLPWDVREISRAIDKFPLRRQEIGRAGVTP